MPLTKEPLVSICIPAYKQTDFLRILLDSITRQSFTDYEIIITDDSPNEEIKDLLKSYTFPVQPTYVHNPKQLGSPENWNAAIELARGKFIKIMHHDDAFNDPLSLGELVNEIESGPFDYVFGETRVENVKYPVQSRTHRIRSFKKYVTTPSRLFFGNAIGAPSTLLLKKSLTSHIKYDKRFIWLVDVEYYIKLFKYSKNGNVVHKPLILTHDSAGHQITTQISSDFDLKFKEQVLLYIQLQSSTSRYTRFLMEIFMLRLLFKENCSNKELLETFTEEPTLLRIYFKFRKNVVFHYSLYLFVRMIDLFRKLTF